MQKFIVRPTVPIIENNKTDFINHKIEHNGKSDTGVGVRWLLPGGGPRA